MSACEKSNEIDKNTIELIVQKAIENDQLLNEINKAILKLDKPINQSILDLIGK